MAELRVVRPGILTTVQDLGRPALGRWGVSPGGAMDALALRAANRLLGNLDDAAALEITGPGFQAVFDAATAIALAGADLGARVGEREAPPWRVHAVAAGETIAFTQRLRGARALLAVPGGFDVPRALGSAATDLDGGFGGHHGRALRHDDRLPFRPATTPAQRDESALAAFYADPSIVRYVPQSGAPPLDGLAFRVGAASNRTGYRLEGPSLPGRPADEISEALAPGAIQIPPDGHPIMLLADRQTVGGYTCAGHIARVDLPKAAQLWPGDAVSFQAIGLPEAQRLAREQQATLDRIFGSPG